MSALIHTSLHTYWNRVILSYCQIHTITWADTQRVCLFDEYDNRCFFIWEETGFQHINDPIWLLSVGASVTYFYQLFLSHKPNPWLADTNAKKWSGIQSFMEKVTDSKPFVLLLQKLHHRVAFSLKYCPAELNKWGVNAKCHMNHSALLLIPGCWCLLTAPRRLCPSLSISESFEYGPELRQG